MCGIFLSVGFPPNPAHVDAVAHRGPDGRGWRVFESPAGPVALGHRRLAIIDLDDRALQPMCSDDGRYWLVFNGEIYNFIELRDELRAAGHRFSTTSDSEVLLKAFQHWGAASLDRLIGMYAFVVWDDQLKQLFVARDRMGIKPLFYHASDRGFAAGSEIKQFFDLPGFSRRMNLDRAHNFLSNGITDHLATTLFQDAFNLGPGRYIHLDLRSWRPGSPLNVVEYWRPPAPENFRISEEEAAETFRGLFMDSIQLHMRADVRVGSCLSGGLDSSSIVAAQAKLWPANAEPLNAVSAIFPNSSVDESSFIAAVVQQTGVKSSLLTLDPHAMFADSAAIVRAQDEPYGSTSIHAQYRVFSRARDLGIKVMMDGQGADELLGGYHGCFHYHYARLIREARLGELMQTLQERKAWHGIGYREQLAPFIRRLPAPFHKLASGNVAASKPLPSWMDTDLLQQHRPREGSIIAQAILADGLALPKTLGSYCQLLTRTTSLPMLLRYEDRNSMAHGIEARVPFLDHRLVEFALRLGNQHKIVGGDTKRVLRRSMSDLLPPTVLNRRDKIGFATPEEFWFKGPLRKKIETGVEDTLALYPDLLDADATRQFAKQSLDGLIPYDSTLWRIVVFGIWGRELNMSL